MPKLTKTLVESVNPDPKRDVFVWDTQLPGFGLRVYPSGRRKYVVQYRTRGNRQRRAVLGTHGTLTAEQARTMARDMLAQVSGGGDPAGDIKAAREAPTVADLATDYLERHAIPNKRPASVKDDQSMLDRVILPRLGKVKAAAVTRRDVEVVHNGLRSKPYSANRVLALLSKMFNLAVAWGWRGDNPAKGIPRFPEDKSERWLNADELTRLWSVPQPPAGQCGQAHDPDRVEARRGAHGFMGSIRSGARGLDQAEPPHEAEAHGACATEWTDPGALGGHAGLGRTRPDLSVSGR